MKILMRLALAAMLACSGGLLAEQFEKGVNYLEIQPAPPQGKVGDKIEVVEFFMFSCPHCYHFEPKVKAWLKNKPEDIEFVRVPAMFGRHNNMHAQAFYALESMGELERVHEAFFEVIHEKRQQLKTREELDNFIASQGVDMDRFREAMSSFAVAVKTNQAMDLLRRYGIRGVPALVVDRRYKSGRGLNYSSLGQLPNYLAAKVRKERKLTN